MSTFFGFNIAKSGLFTAQKALNVVSQNIANAETPGYSRQRVEQKASNPMGLAGGTGMLGTGVESGSVSQIRNEFLDLKFRKENTIHGEWEARTNSLSEIESTINEPGQTGITKSIDNLFSSMQELSKDASSLTARALVRQRGVAFSDTLNTMSSQLSGMVKDMNFEINSTVSQINTHAKDIANLNDQIYKSELDGNKANDLRDQRNLLMDKLSTLVKYDVTELKDSINSSGKMILSVNGQPLVSHDKTNLITADTKELHNTVPGLEVSSLKWQTGEKIMTNSLNGQLRAQLDMRDNKDGSTKGIPYYIDKLNEFTTRLTAEFNAQHFAGYGLDDAGGNKVFFEAKMSKDTDKPGNFTVNNDLLSGQIHDPSKVTLGITTATSIKDYIEKQKNATPAVNENDAIKAWEKKYSGYTLAKDNTGTWYETSKITAADIKISKDVQDDLDNIAAAKVFVNGKAAVGDSTNIKALADVRYDSKMFAWGQPDDFIKSLVSNLGVDTQSAQNMTKNQETLIAQIDNQRQATSGVSLDEEMSNMVKFQHAYNAASRMITTIDEMIDVIINRMGKVGL